MVEIWKPNNWRMTFEGKVRKLYEAKGVNAVAMVAGDGVSAFDKRLGAIIPDKGKVLTRMSAFWMQMIEGQLGIPTAFITNNVAEMDPFFQRAGFDERTTLQLKLRMLPVEIIVRGFNTGSSWKLYSEGEREICGQKMPDDMREFDKFPVPLLTPTTKAPEGEHDINITLDQMRESFEQAGFSSRYVEEIRDFVFPIWRLCTDFAKRRGIIILDTKLEFGVDENGTLRLADEVFTPDSSRFVAEKDFRPREARALSLDKQVIRDWVKTHPDQKLPNYVLEETALRYKLAEKMLTAGF